MTIDSGHFRRVLSQFPTGVVVVTALDADEAPLGMTVGSFTSVSLDPPLVAFLPSRTSASWRAMRTCGERFGVNILGADQEDVCRAVATRRTGKFDGIGWHTSDHGTPVLAGAVAHLDCTVEQIHDAGDHEIVIGRVEALDALQASYPLLFFRGGYGSFDPHSMAAADGDLLDRLRLVDLARDHMDALADSFDTEVNAFALVRDEVVLMAASGQTACTAAPTRVGHRVPFVPPLGSVYAAWGGDELRARWIDALEPDASPSYRTVPDRVRDRGFSITFDHAPSAHLEDVTSRLRAGDTTVTRSTLDAAIRDLADSYNPEHVFTGRPRELRSLAAPVFDGDGGVAFSLTLWGPGEPCSDELIQGHIEALLRTTEAASRALADARTPALT